MEVENLTTQQFWTSILILIHNYHAVNRKIFACIVEEVCKVKNSFDPSNPLNEERLEKTTESELQNDLNKEYRNCAGYVIKQKLLFKKLEDDISAIGILDFKASSYTCKFTGSNLDDFIVKLNENELHLEALTERNPTETSKRLLDHVLKPKLLKWALNETTKRSTKSLQLIDVEAYNKLYKDLKSRHAETLKKIWLEANESTDPLKFIYEDLAIAAYLICLWQTESVREPIAFADLGCGNGLLVHVLNQEGYAGYGFDIRMRKIWSLYPASIQTRLIEAAVVPFEFVPPCEVNWLIGNHSDELSAWLPVLTALKRYDMSYFLLPCCAFEFSGAKFQRRDAKLSTYQDFFGYAREISLRCGFQTHEDRLKIPSTKRLALVGSRRLYEQSQHELKCTELRAFISAEMQRYPHMSGQDAQIKLRDKHELVRNCTKLDRDILAALVVKIFKLLLTTPVSNEHFDDRWHPGGRLKLKEIVRSLTQQELQHIKSECGGIKTLLRNKHEVFEFLGNDLIGLRRPCKKHDRPQAIKRRQCYFNENHPDGCPLNESDCNFLHIRLS